MVDQRTIDIIEELIAFDTTSRESNLELIAYTEDYLGALGVECTLVHNETGNKANLYATIGDPGISGIMLSGHTDVVPVDGQEWTTDPFRMTLGDGRLYGRGSCDMKGFIGTVLAKLPDFLKRDLEVPLHLAFSYDEEVGCLGARRLIEVLNAMPVKPAMCIVGEPTNMDVVVGHKGKRSYDVHVRGLEAHSSLAPHAVNAVDYAAELIVYLKSLAHELADSSKRDNQYDVPYTTIHTGRIAGGTALSIVPKDCRLTFEIRAIGEDDPIAIEKRIRAYASEILEPEMRKVDEDSGFEITCTNDLPGLDTPDHDYIVAFVKKLTKKNDSKKVAYGTEAGLFQRNANIPSVICGPGDIAHAHKPDEFVTVEQIEECERFLERLMDTMVSKSD